MNLLSNAVKYTPEGGTIHFTIRELPYEREGYALFQTVVEDTGIGISKEYIPHLFEAFSREKSSSESGIIGTGLGLRIVKKFVDLMEGSIVVESEIGEGTRFTVTIPHRIATANEYISEENAKELPEEIKNALLSKHTHMCNGTLNILLVKFLIKRNGCIKIVNQLVCLLRKSSAP